MMIMTNHTEMVNLMSCKIDKITRKTANEIKAMLEAEMEYYGIMKIDFIGSIARQGYSYNDIDFKVLCDKNQCGETLYETSDLFMEDKMIPRCEHQLIDMLIGLSSEGFYFEMLDENNYLYEDSSPVFHYINDDKDIKLDFVVITTSTKIYEQAR